jgi:hypothetical protein
LNHLDQVALDVGVHRPLAIGSDQPTARAALGSAARGSACRSTSASAPTAKQV